MKRSGDADQVHSETGEDASIVGRIRVGQCRARKLVRESHVVELATNQPQARLDVTKALAVGQLSEHHRQIPIPAGQDSGGGTHP